MAKAPDAWGERGGEPPRYRTWFWQPFDLWAAVTAGVGALVVYLVTLAPSVTLEDSGELATAAWGFGVPHPPGYPVWTLVAWIWVHIIPAGNIAWRTNLLSAVFSATAVGLLALLVSRSGRVAAARLISREESVEQRLPQTASAVAAVVAGWLLAFSPAFWSQAVITEVYGMNACLLMMVLVGLYRWSFATEERWRLYLGAFLWGAGMGTHQTQVLLAVALPFFVWRADREVGRGLLAVVLGMLVLAIGVTAVRSGGLIRQGSFSAVVMGGCGVGATVWLFFLWRSGASLLSQWRVVGAICGAVILGLAFYLYEPLASVTNPPMNWGYTRSLDGFWQHFTRMQYAPVVLERTLLDGWAQLNAFLFDLQVQFNIVYAVLGLAVWFFYREMTRFSRDWLWFLLTAFVSVGLGFVLLLNSSHEKLQVLSDRVFFLPAYCIYAVWVGYSLALILVFVLRRWVREHPKAEWWITAALLLPLVPLLGHRFDNSQRHHTFGYEYGYRMFKPGGAYPEMERNAILFAGSDSGRFVATYMVFVESQSPTDVKTYLPQHPDCLAFDRRDVYVISQDTIAGPTYLRYLRDQYGASRPSTAKWWQRWLGRDTLYPPQPIWLPSFQDWQEAVNHSLLQLRRPRRQVVTENGRFEIRDPEVLNALNAGLSRMIFERNKQQQPFYVEENEVMPWMYPYLEPYGVILRLRSEPVVLFTPYEVGRDRRYWDDLTQDLLSDIRFTHDPVARLVFSNARATIAAVYAHHRMHSEAEYAFAQALQLYPDSTDATLRFAQFYLQNDRFDDAIRLLNTALKRDPYNKRLHDLVNQVNNTQRVTVRLRQLEEQHASQPSNHAVTLELLNAYAIRQEVKAMDKIVNELLSQPLLRIDDLMQVADLYDRLNRLDRVVDLLTACVQRHPNHAPAWYQLAAIYSLRGDCYNSIIALTRALALEGPGGPMRTAVKEESRFDACRHDPLFQKTISRP